MSLINDALKRASDKPRANPDLPAAIPIMKPAPEESGGGRPWTIVLILLVAAVGIALWYRQKPQDPLAQAVKPTPVQSTPAFSNPVARAANVLNKVADRNQEGDSVAQTIATPAPVTPAPVPLPLVKPSEPAPKAFPALKLQAIYFRMTNPAAVLNGRTLNVGQSIAGAKVIAINRNAVEVEFEGAKKTLALK